MSMLSEPRQRRKWLLSPGAGQAWVSDDNKYGQKLMEKMGWTKGKGLGREEQGNPEHIRISLKDNKKGIGYKGYDDQWIKHYEGFEDVLSKLNNIEETESNSKDCSRAASSDEESQSIQSLERRSKCSRARVHYHKFARGKDLSRYSKDDIACITGSKRAKQLAEEENEADKSDETDEPALPSDTPQITTINSGSVQDYFAQKMAQLKGKLPLALMQPKEYESDEELRVGFGMKHEYNKKINEQEIKVQTAIHDSYKVEIYDESKTMEAEEENGLNMSPEGETDQQERKKKKKKKRAERDAEAKVEEQEIISHEVSIDDGVSTSKKKKKKKKRELEVEFPEENEYKREEQMTVSDEIISHEGRLEHDELPKKKKKTKKEKIVEQETVNLDDIAKENKDFEKREEQEKSITQGEDEQHVEVKVPKKKKKQRKMQEPITGEETITQLEAEDNQEVLAGEKKNNKKRKEREGETVNDDENNVEEALNDDECTQKQKKKRKKSKKKPRKAKEVTSSQMKQEQANSEEGQE